MLCIRLVQKKMRFVILFFYTIHVLPLATFFQRAVNASFSKKGCELQQKNSSVKQNIVKFPGFYAREGQVNSYGEHSSTTGRRISLVSSKHKSYVNM